jgi:hypothetical protein
MTGLNVGIFTLDNHRFGTGAVKNPAVALSGPSRMPQHDVSGVMPREVDIEMSDKASWTTRRRYPSYFNKLPCMSELTEIFDRCVNECTPKAIHGYATIRFAPFPSDII